MMIEFPWRLRHFANTTGSFWAKANHAKKLRALVAWHLLPIRSRPALPCQVTITRLAPRSLDSDNLVHACKHVRDEVAKWIGVDDRHDDQVHYVCKQQHTDPGKYYVRIEFQSLSPPPTQPSKKDKLT